METIQNSSDSLLDLISNMPEDKKPGKLKIFLGYAAGVGKTCAMLSAAQEEQKNGVDVVAGYIEPHARREISSLIEEIELYRHWRSGTYQCGGKPSYEKIPRC